MDDILKDENGKIIYCECGGIFKWNGAVLTSIPPQFPYTCDKCKKIKVKRENNSIYDW